MSALSNVIIFPSEWHTSPTIENEMLSRFDIATCLPLSQVNKAAQSVLNHEHFRLLFHKFYSKMCNSPNLFKNLIYFHPDICWKVAGYALSHPQFFPRSPIFFEDPSKAVLPLLEESARKYREICGRGYQDPDSPIHKAWIASNEAQHRFTHLASSYQQALLDMVDMLTSFNDLTDRRQLMRHIAIEAIASVFLLPPNQRSFGQLTEILKGYEAQYKIKAIDEDIRTSIFECFEKVRDNDMNKVEEEKKHLAVRYKELESERLKWGTLSEAIQRSVQVFSKTEKPSVLLEWKLRHHNALVEEMAFARAMEHRNFNDMNPLRKLSELAHVFLCIQKRGVPIPIHSEAFPSLPVLLNSCACSGTILEALYLRVTQEHGLAAWQASPMENIINHLEIFAALVNVQQQGFIDLFGNFSDSFEQHPCQMKDPHWSDPQGKEIWRQKMQTFANSLLPENYLNNPERNQTIFQTDTLLTETIPEEWIGKAIVDMDRLETLQSSQDLSEHIG